VNRWDRPGGIKNTPGTSEHRGLGCGVGILVGGPAAFGLVVLVANAFAACDVGINGGANGLSLLFALPVLWILNALVFMGVFTLIAERTSQPRTFGVVVGILAVLVLAWALFAWLGTPSDYPAPFCPGNVPPWWPSWLPA